MDLTLTYISGISYLVFVTMFLRGFVLQKFNTIYTLVQLTGDTCLSFLSTSSYVETGSQKGVSRIRPGLDEYIGLRLSFEGGEIK